MRPFALPFAAFRPAKGRKSRLRGISLMSLMSLIGLIRLIGLISPIGLISIISPIRLISLISPIRLIGLIRPIVLIGSLAPLCQFLSYLPLFFLSHSVLALYISSRSPPPSTKSCFSLSMNFLSIESVWWISVIAMLATVSSLRCAMASR